jgi:hypothetical protein
VLQEENVEIQVGKEIQEIKSLDTLLYDGGKGREDSPDLFA